MTAPGKQPDDSGDARPREDHYSFGFDKGGVPGYLVFVYVAFLVFACLYLLDWLIPSWWSLEQHIEP